MKVIFFKKLDNNFRICELIEMKFYTAQLFSRVRVLNL
jgi:hypothetical protein